MPSSGSFIPQIKVLIPLTSIGTKLGSNFLILVHQINNFSLLQFWVISKSVIR